MKNLKLLRLEAFNLVTIRANMFKGLDSLSILSIVNCKVRMIEEGAFNGLENLIHLGLIGNILKPFDDNELTEFRDKYRFKTDFILVSFDIASFHRQVGQNLQEILFEVLTA